MGVFRWIAWLVGALWRFSRRSWIDTGIGLRPRSGASALYLFLFLIFFLIGAVLMLLGFDLDDVDVWIDAQAGWLDAVGSFLFRAVCGLVVLLCATMVVMILYEKLRGHSKRDLTTPVFGTAENRVDEEGNKPPGFGCALIALIVGYFAWYGFAYPA